MLFIQFNERNKVALESVFSDYDDLFIEGLHENSMHLALHDLDLHSADEADENASPVEEVDLLMKIAESMPGVSTRFD